MARVFAVVVVGLLLWAPPVMAQAPTPAPSAPGVTLVQDTPSKERLAWALELLNGRFEGLEAARFTPEFNRELPPTQLEKSLRDLFAAGGGFELREVSGGAPGDGFVSAALSKKSDGSNWTLNLRVEPEAPYRIETMRLLPVAVPRAANAYDGWGVLDADLRELGMEAGFSAWEVKPDGSAASLLHQWNGDRRMAIGTASALFVLGALAEMVDAGRAQWRQGLAIDDGLKSVPPSRTGVTPMGRELQLREYARRMMGESDNTAADHLISFLGRENVEARLAKDHAGPDPGRGAAEAPGPVADDPFLMTQELYRLKCSIDPDLLKRYAAADGAERRRMLDADVPKATMLEDLLKAWARPQELARVGWFSTPDALCREAARLWGLSRKPGMEPVGEAMRAGEDQPAAVAPLGGAWKTQWSKLGGEPGAVCAVWLLERQDGRVFTVAFVFNNATRGVDGGRTSRIIAGALGLVGQM